MSLQIDQPSDVVALEWDRPEPCQQGWTKVQQVVVRTQNPLLLLACIATFFLPKLSVSSDQSDLIWVMMTTDDESSAVSCPLSAVIDLCTGRSTRGGVATLTPGWLAKTGR